MILLFTKTGNNYDFAHPENPKHDSAHRKTPKPDCAYVKNLKGIFQRENSKTLMLQDTSIRDSRRITSVVQRLDSIFITLVVVCLNKKQLILSQKPLRIRVQPKLKHPNKRPSYGDCKINSRYKDKDYTKDMTAVPFIPVTFGPSSVHKLSLSGRKYFPFWRLDVDLDMHMSFLYAALFETNSQSLLYYEHVARIEHNAIVYQSVHLQGHQRGREKKNKES